LIHKAEASGCLGTILVVFGPKYKTTERLRVVHDRSPAGQYSLVEKEQLLRVQRMMRYLAH
jgi:hypothetical protein